MCGIAATLTAAGAACRTTQSNLAAMRDAMAHRGPDGSGLFFQNGIGLAHRRLAVIETSAAGLQPMQSVCGRYIIAYNGELYNTPELRRDLQGAGFVFRSKADTEVVLAALTAWGTQAMSRLRGMYAFVFVDLYERKAIVARDPLGIKPVYWASLGGNELLIASELQGLLTHPHISAEPNLAATSAYITTIRTTIGAETLFAGLNTLLPGEWLSVDCSQTTLKVQTIDWWSATVRDPGSYFPLDDRRGINAVVRSEIEDSIARHLASDVPLCSLLSGGIDSTIIAGHTAGLSRGSQPLCTYCSGHTTGEDFAFARMAAEAFGTDHHEVPVTRALFAERWPEMVQRLGVPLSTPNEVAINQVARQLRAGGNVVALSGEGADELFGGYDKLMTDAAVFSANPSGDPGLFALKQASWIPIESKAAILNEDIWRDLKNDEHLQVTYRDEYRRLALRAAPESKTASDPVNSHLEIFLRMQRRINLSGLLARLDTATMLEGVEGRTPFADQSVASLAEALPMRLKFWAQIHDEDSGNDGGVATATKVRAAQGKIILRQAFADLVPQPILARPKASFPLPFQDWVSDSAHCVRNSALCRALFNQAAIETVATSPNQAWHIAWPMINLAMWSHRWWD